MKLASIKTDKHSFPIFISAIISLITFLVVWQIGAAVLPAVYILLQILTVLWIASLLLPQFIPQSEKYVSFTAIGNAYLIYLGAFFISFSRFKEEISKVPLDLSVVGIGIALMGIGLGFTAQRQEQKIEDENLAESSTVSPVPNEATGARPDRQLPSIDIVLDEVRRKLDFQFGQIDSLDTKSGIILAGC